MHLLIDSDILRYQVGAIGVRNVYDKYHPNSMIPAPTEMIHYHVDKMIERSNKATGADSFICVLSGKGNFRFDIAKTQPYKGNRSGAQRPYHYHTVGDYIMERYPHIVVDEMEADDWIGIQQRSDLINTVTASRDKDLTTFPGWHFRFSCGEKQPEVPLHWINEFDAWKFFFKQMLIGDNTDNIMGCGIKKLTKWGSGEMLRRKGVGPKAADELLSECHTVAQMYMVIWNEYRKLFGDGADGAMLENARLLYIGQTPSNLFEWSWIEYGITDPSLGVGSDDTTRIDQSSVSADGRDVSGDFNHENEDVF